LSQTLSQIVANLFQILRQVGIILHQNCHVAKKNGFATIYDNSRFFQQTELQFNTKCREIAIILELNPQHVNKKKLPGDIPAKFLPMMLHFDKVGVNNKNFIVFAK